MNETEIKINQYIANSGYSIHWAKKLYLIESFIRVFFIYPVSNYGENY